MRNEVDILENDIIKNDSVVLKTLLIDRNKITGNNQYGNIIWATDVNVDLGDGYGELDEIKIEAISGERGYVLKPRVLKSQYEKEYRIKDKAEVFTPSWICNKQNNLVDNAWFGEDNLFNRENGNGWETNSEPIRFPSKSGKSWQEYVKDVRLEVSCGEAPYLISRYDTISGTPIPIKDRIGILDRKLRVVSENTKDKEEWTEWALWAFKSTYGYEWQGDNLLIARENLLFTFLDYYFGKFNEEPSKTIVREIATIISWNLWQMDGLKGVVPYSCHDEIEDDKMIDSPWWGETEKEIIKCKGCTNNDIYKHNGIYCRIKDWETGRVIKFVSLIKKN